MITFTAWLCYQHSEVDGAEDARSGVSKVSSDGVSAVVFNPLEPPSGVELLLWYVLLSGGLVMYVGDLATSANTRVYS